MTRNIRKSSTAKSPLLLLEGYRIVGIGKLQGDLKCHNCGQGIHFILKSRDLLYGNASKPQGGTQQSFIRESLRQGPAPHPFTYHLSRKVLTNGTPFTYLV